MLVLVSKPLKSLLHVWRPNLGLLLQPRSWWVPDESVPWACDNDAFNGGIDEEAYLKMLEKVQPLQGCLWITAPDVVGDADATLDLFAEWAPVIETTGKPIALVAQDGLTPADVPWLSIDCLFIGGTTTWKLSPDAQRLCAEAKNQGKLLHMGRVNGLRRLRAAKSWGCDSVDGSASARFTDEKLPGWLEFAAKDAQLTYDLHELEGP